MKAKQARPQSSSVTYKVPTGDGRMFVTISYDDKQVPDAVIINLGKAGSTAYAAMEAIGRLVTLLLRLEDPGTPAERLKAIVEELEDIGGGTFVRMGPTRIVSAPDGLSYILRNFLEEIWMQLPIQSESPSQSSSTSKNVTVTESVEQEL